MSVERDAAGKRLAQELGRSADPTGSVVVGIPKGGAIVGAQVALELGLAYECVPVFRIGMPCFPDLTLGAIDPDGVATFDPQTQLTQHEMAKSRGAMAERLREQVEHCRGDRTPVDLTGRSVIVVDDEASSPIVALAAATYLRRHGVARLVFATPAATSETTASLRDIYDDIVVGTVGSASSVVGFYGDSTPSDDEVRDCITRAWDASASV